MQNHLRLYLFWQHLCALLTGQAVLVRQQLICLGRWLCAHTTAVLRGHGFRRWSVGQGLVEYALILVLIAVVAIGALTLVGDRTEQVYDQVQCALSGGEYHQDNGNGNSNKCK